MKVSIMDSDHESGEHFLTHSEVVVSEGDFSTPAKKSGSSSSSSSSSSFSSEDDLYQLDESQIHMHYKSVSDTLELVELVFEEQGEEVISKTSPEIGDSQGGANENITEASSSTGEYPSSSGQELTSGEVRSGSEELDSGLPGSDQISHKLQPTMMQSPPVQVMERPVETSRYRIPSHVFERSKSGTPADWSVASNESLFSLHVGNNSFSTDHVVLMSRSGELGKYGDTISSYTQHSSPPSPVPVFESEMKIMSVEDRLEVEEEAADRNKAKVQPVDETPKSCSHRSDGSRDSMQSFAFPINKKMKKRKKKRWCACLICSSSDSWQACCVCTWPSFSCSKCTRLCCHCTWPSCSCLRCSSTCCHCTWPFCSCLKCSSTCCHCTWPSCFWINCRGLCSHCQWPSCSCSKCYRPCCKCASPSCSCFSCFRTCNHCTWPSCNGRRVRSHCNCLSCFRSNRCRSCCLCKWPSCNFLSNCCRCKCISCSLPNCKSCCSCKWPSCSLPSCGGCFRCKWPSCPLPNCGGGSCRCKWSCSSCCKLR